MSPKRMNRARHVAKGGREGSAYASVMCRGDDPGPINGSNKHVRPASQARQESAEGGQIGRGVVVDLADVRHVGQPTTRLLVWDI